jgi:hypothetical protein
VLKGHHFVKRGVERYQRIVQASIWFIEAAGISARTPIRLNPLHFGI